MFFTSTHLHYAFDLADSLSATLGAPVELTDAHLRSIARSSNRGRVASGQSPGFRGIAGTRAEPVDLREPLIIPAVPQLGLAAVRVLPLWVRGNLEGVLWVTDVNGDLTPYQLDYAQAVSIATIDALVLAAERMPPMHEGSALNAIIALGSPVDARAAIDSAISSGRFSHDGRFIAVTISVEPKNNHYVTIADLPAHLATVGEQVAQAYSSGRSLVAQYGSECSVLVAAFPHEDECALLERLLSRAHNRMSRPIDHQLHAAWVIGASSTAAGLTEAAEVVQQSRRAAQLGLRLGWRNRTVEWASVRHINGLVSLGASDAQVNVVPPKFIEFFCDPRYEDLVKTLRVFLERAGNIQAVASDLFVHRASVYHRLKRVQQILGVDLTDGHDRLDVHLNLMSWMLLHEIDPN